MQLDRKGATANCVKGETGCRYLVLQGGLLFFLTISYFNLAFNSPRFDSHVIHEAYIDGRITLRCYSMFVGVDVQRVRCAFPSHNGCPFPHMLHLLYTHRQHLNLFTTHDICSLLCTLGDSLWFISPPRSRRQRVERTTSSPP